MSHEVKALLIFCEGSHDTAFVRMVLKKLLGYQVVKLKFSEMPSPFNSLFETTVKSHAAQDMSLDMAHKFFLPDTILRQEDSMVFIYNSGGKTQYEKVRALLSTYMPLFEQAKIFPQKAKKIVQSVKYLFLYDADTEGIEAISKNLERDFSQIDGKNFIYSPWQNAGSNFGRIAKDKAVFVWGKSPDAGTLEDLLMPMFGSVEENRLILDKVKKAITDMFKWKIDAHKTNNSATELAKYQKAVLTTVGQRKKPGSSLSVILEQSGFITEDVLKASQITTEFVQFFKEFANTQH